MNTFQVKLKKPQFSSTMETLRKEDSFIGFCDETWIFPGIRQKYSWCDNVAESNPFAALKEGLQVSADKVKRKKDPSSKERLWDSAMAMCMTVNDRWRCLLQRQRASAASSPVCSPRRVLSHLWSGAPTRPKTGLTTTERCQLMYVSEREEI